MDFNRAQIIGNVTRDPELRNTPNGQSVCSFGVATNRTWKDRDSGERKQAAEFHNVVAWSGLAQTCSQYLKKGSRVFIEGRMQTRNWEDPSGNKRNRTEIVAENMIMLDRPGQSPMSSAPSQDSAGASAPQSAPADDGEINVEEIPF
ncbi:MAG: single-stranded DNA-binding protein [Candidatus Nomurabacteria bacterium]|nr:MAG: single-stranded DNA-binding protein [Candidatus Nomurabacteria bacterium]